MRQYDELPEKRPPTPLLDRISAPADLRALPAGSLRTLADELRAYLLWSVAQTGGHFGAGLGVIELTVALHYAFETPAAALVWDVGHQTYPHKILTGRRERMLSMRQQQGLAPFPDRDESPFDVFGTGHSSTSISAAMGLALARGLAGDPAPVVAVIGDGAMTAGMAFEALNHAAHSGANLLVILNDNAMSISPNVGGLSQYLARQQPQGGDNSPGVPGGLFEELGFRYRGPVDGHDLDALLAALRAAQAEPGPRLVHVITRKGRGYGPAERNPFGLHALTKIEPRGRNEPAPSGPKYCNLFGQWLLDTAERDPRLVGITPAMREGSDLVAFSERFPERYHDVAIAEQHAVTLAAGLACGGAKPVVAIYSTFLQRAYDQLVHDVALQNLDVTFALDRAGLVEDGPTHAGIFDLAFARCIPNLVIMAPADENETRLLLNTAYAHPGPALVRYPRGRGPGTPVTADTETVPIGQGRRLRAGSRVALLGFGSRVQAALEAGETLDASVVDLRFVKPLDHDLLAQMAASHDLLVTVEEHVIAGGAGAGVNEWLAASGRRNAIMNLGLPDVFPEHGDPEALLAAAGLDTDGIVKAVRARLEALG
ncbi:MAG: 1-deoxy-D-xylulose-5-phosphate synthase [Gammaproteobacteria bacterium]|nr:1-deoxy-D-xylulose-5-phosphate synthase [Gammaproteobacteria bacterium]